MSNLVKGTMHGKIIELEQPLPIPEGSTVWVSVEPLRAPDEERRRRIFDLSGSWKHDPSIATIFEEIAQERRAHRGREVRID